jgi:predicted secreted protein
VKLSSIIAIYALFWSMSFFFVLPFRPGAQAGMPAEQVPGQADSAPARFSFGRTCLWTTIVSAGLFALYYANYVHGWVMPEALDFFTPPNG